MGIFNFFKKKSNKKEIKDTSHNILKSIKPGIAKARRIKLDLSNLNDIRNNFITFDVETTGLNAISDRIVELGAAIFSNGKVINTFSTLVNPKVSIPQAASKINNITNTMLTTAPSEEEVYPKLMEFLGKASQGKITMCAHNAKFDFDFLCNTLSRLGIDAKFSYIDTLDLAREHLDHLKYYKQCTIESHFGLTNAAAHRAYSDAENCGHILYQLMDIAEQSFKKERRKKEITTLTIHELEVCAYIQKLIADRGGDTNPLRFRKNTNRYIEVSCFHSFLNFKFSKKGKYILIKRNCPAISNFITESSTQSEGGTGIIRVYFSSPFDLEPLATYIFNEYYRCYETVYEYVSISSCLQQELIDSSHLMRSLDRGEVAALLQTAKDFDYPPVDVSLLTRSSISRNEVVIKAINSRVPINEIKNRRDWDRGFDMGFPYWDKGETLRKEGNIEKAIELFDLARYNGYKSPALYDSYAIAYRKLKDFSNEIVILDEAILRMPEHAGIWEARRDKAIKLLYVQQKSKQ